MRVGITETRTWWQLPVLGQHILIAGATGAGKGSVLWSLIAGLAPQVKTGRVRLCVIDPKGGMELGAGAPMFSMFCHHTGEPTVELLRQLVALMQTRANRLRGHTRLHTPTPAEPLIVVVIDEIAALTAYVTDRKLRAEIEQLLGLLFSQGRAVGYIGGGRGARPRQRHPAGAAAVHRADRTADDRSYPNRDGLGPRSPRCRRRMRPDR